MGEVIPFQSKSYSPEAEKKTYLPEEFSQVEMRPITVSEIKEDGSQAIFTLAYRRRERIFCLLREGKFREISWWEMRDIMGPTKYIALYNTDPNFRKLADYFEENRLSKKK